MLFKCDFVSLSDLRAGQKVDHFDTAVSVAGIVLQRSCAAYCNTDYAGFGNISFQQFPIGELLTDLFLNAKLVYFPL